MSWLRRLRYRSRRQRALDQLYARRVELVHAIRRQSDPFHPTVGENHTNGVYDGINYAISLLEGRE
jgi:hypothetical protein